MPRGRQTSLTIRLTPAERETLMAWQRATTIPAGLARRGRILLLLADGVTINAIAATVGMDRKHIYKWIERFVQEGVEGLTDRPRGRPWSKLHRPDRPDASDADIVF
jgi:biotin operon repressor